MTPEEEANEKSLRRIRDAKEAGALELDLSELLSRLPREPEQLTPFQDLNLSGCWRLSDDLTPLAGLTSLQSLNLHGCGQLSGDLAPLAGLTSLQSLNLHGCGQFGGDLSPLTGLTSLRSLDLFWCEHLIDISPLASLASLRSLNLSGCEHLINISPLASLTSLRSLDLGGCGRLMDIPPSEPHFPSVARPIILSRCSQVCPARTLAAHIERALLIWLQAG